MVEYVLEHNELTGESEKYKGQVVNSRSYTFDDIAKYLIKHNTGLSSSVIYGLWEGIKGAVEEFISDGGAISTDLFHARISIKGVFDGVDDKFDANRHQIRLDLRPGFLLRNIPKGLKVKKLKAGAKIMIFSVTDVKTGMVNSILTPGKIIKINGSRLKIKGDDPSCGVYFIPERSHEKPVKIEPSEFVVNNPSEIIAVIPNLSRGIWNLKLVTQCSRGLKCLKTPRSVTFEKRFSVS